MSELYHIFPVFQHKPLLFLLKLQPKSLVTLLVTLLRRRAEPSFLSADSESMQWVQVPSPAFFISS